MPRPWRTVYQSKNKRVLVKPDRKFHPPARLPDKPYQPPPRPPPPASSDQTLEIIGKLFMVMLAVLLFVCVVKFLAVWGPWLVVGFFIYCVLRVMR